ncbi:MAG: EscU/YscU/HrcU family type III secretion system export apparatus switch protein [Chlamydiia bacterium]|nr:EscU/YscU/HrcU family type III secretion system export apparatus switch protein [Chlamydiia bacterium]
MAEKTEQASPRKLRKAHDQGDVPKSKDLTSAIAFAAGYYTMIFTMAFLTTVLCQFCYSLFDVEGYWASLIQGTSGDINLTFCKAMMAQSLIVTLKLGLPAASAACLGSIITSIIVSGAMFTTGVLSFKLSRFNVINNIKSRFSKDYMINFGKQILLAILVGIVIYKTLSEEEIVSIIIFNFTGTIDIISGNIFFIINEVVRKVIIIIILLGILDAAYQTWHYQKKQMMDKQEAKQDFKESEGDPEVKGKRQEFAKELVYSDGPMDATKKSTVLVTNPTHIAIALLYDVDTVAIPIVSGKGSDEVAEKMRDIATDNQISIENNPDLAWKLYAIDIGEEAPSETFQELAKILQAIESIKNKIHA